MSQSRIRGPRRVSADDTASNARSSEDGRLRVRTANQRFAVHAMLRASFRIRGGDDATLRVLRCAHTPRSTRRWHFLTQVKNLKLSGSQGGRVQGQRDARWQCAREGPNHVELTAASAQASPRNPAALLQCTPLGESFWPTADSKASHYLRLEDFLDALDGGATDGALAQIATALQAHAQVTAWRQDASGRAELEADDALDLAGWRRGLRGGWTGRGLGRSGQAREGAQSNARAERHPDGAEVVVGHGAQRGDVVDVVRSQREQVLLQVGAAQQARSSSSGSAVIGGRTPVGRRGRDLASPGGIESIVGGDLRTGSIAAAATAAARPRRGSARWRAQPRRRRAPRPPPSRRATRPRPRHLARSRASSVSSASAPGA